VGPHALPASVEEALGAGGDVLGQPQLPAVAVQAELVDHPVAGHVCVRLDVTHRIHQIQAQDCTRTTLAISYDMLRCGLHNSMQCLKIPPPSIPLLQGPDSALQLQNCDCKMLALDNLRVCCIVTAAVTTALTIHCKHLILAQQFKHMCSCRFHPSSNPLLSKFYQVLGNSDRPKFFCARTHNFAS